MNLDKLKSIKTFGQSMEPLLYDGDVVFLKKIGFSEININDIVCIRQKDHRSRSNSGPHPNSLLRGEGALLTHRVIYRTEKYVITRGDNNNKFDGKIYPKGILGVINKVQRRTQDISINDLYLLQSTFYLKEITKVKNELKKSGVKHVILKGLPVHLYYEGMHPKRLYADCDILVEKKRLSEVRKVLGRLGYRDYDTSYSGLQRRLKKHETEMSFSRNVNGATVSFDIHLEAVFLMTQIADLDTLYPRRLVNEFTNKLIREVRAVEIVGESFEILSPENLYIYLILHLYHHNFTGTYRYDLIKKIVDEEKLDYDKMAQTINGYKLNNFMYPVILLLQKYYGIGFEKSFLQQIKPPPKVMSVVSGQLSVVNIFNGESRVLSGINRFKLLFELSPRRLKRFMVFINPQVIYFILWVLINKLRLLPAFIRLEHSRNDNV